MAKDFSRFELALERLEKKIDEIAASSDFVRHHLSTYLGSGVAVTYLRDETPIYVNSNDFGPSSNYINGGLYEAENLDLLFSFVRDDTVFLDIGANLGFFALQIARRVHQRGKVYAFEPHPELIRLLRGSAFLNGLSTMDGHHGALVSYAFGLGEEAAPVEFFYPRDHLGGGSRTGGAKPSDARILSEIKSVDECMGDNFICDLVKIDVEGHELEVLKGMKATIERSKDIKIVFEKLSQNAGPELQIENLLRGLGLELYAVEPDSRLRRLEPGALQRFSGYALAARAGEGLDETRRTHFSIYPRQLFVPPANPGEMTRDFLRLQGADQDILFHGPYWFLQRGAYRLTFSGDIVGEIELTIAARFGYPVQTFKLDAKIRSGLFTAQHDLIKFEVIGRATGSAASVVLRGLRVERLA